MKMQEIIRSILDLIDRVENPKSEQEVIVVAQPEETGQLSPFSHAGDDINRFKQIVDLANQPNPHAEYSNEPNERYADIEAVTTHAGGGMNGPKHPHDIRVKDISAYPNQQEC